MTRHPALAFLWFWCHHASVKTYLPWDLITHFDPRNTSKRVLAVVVSVHPSVTSWCSTVLQCSRITQTTPCSSPGILVIWCRKSWQNSNVVTPNDDSKCKSGRLHAGEVAENWRLPIQSVANLARSRVITLNFQLHVRYNAVCRARLLATSDPCSNM